MNCRDFREIADTYLCDELLVETNHEVFRHLEHCADCRKEMGVRREIRTKLRSAIVNAEESTISPIFANKLSINLRDQEKRKSWFDVRFFAPLFASLLIAASIGFVWFTNGNSNSESLRSQRQLALQALNRHEDCTKQHLNEWQETKERVSAEKASFVKSLATDETKILDEHDCEFEGKLFTHYVLQRGEKVISVLKTESASQIASNIKDAGSIICEKQNGLQVASFQNSKDSIFVVSEMSEAENLNIARKLSDSI